MENKMEGMNKAERTAYLAGGNVTVRKLQQIIDGDIRTTYAGNLRGLACRNSEGRWQFETPEEARENAVAFRTKCAGELLETWLDD